MQKVQRENERLRRKLALTEALLDLQKKRWPCWRLSS